MTKAIAAATEVGLVLPADLTGIADSIRAEWGKGLDSQFAIGHLLNKAYSLLVPPGSDNAAKASYTQWLADQGFAFSQPTAWRLREAASREQEVRDFLAVQSPVNGRDMGPTTAIQRLNATTADTGVGEGERDPQALNPGFVSLRTGIYRLLGWEVADDGSGKPTKNGLTGLPTDQLAEVKTLVEALAEAFGEAMRARRAASA